MASVEDTFGEGDELRGVEMETGRITITRVLGEDGSDTHFVESSDDLGFIESLGLIEAAKDTIIRKFMGEFDEGDK